MKIFNLEDALVSPDTLNRNDDLYKLDKLDRIVRFDDIIGFVYGSFSSRFWMMRMGMSQLILENSERTQRIKMRDQDRKIKEEQIKIKKRKKF